VAQAHRDQGSSSASTTVTGTPSSSGSATRCASADRQNADTSSLRARSTSSSAAEGGAAAGAVRPPVITCNSAAAFAEVSAASAAGTEWRTIVAPVVSRTAPSAVMSAIRIRIAESSDRRPRSAPTSATTPL
jgi:hypothetical protein